MHDKSHFLRIAIVVAAAYAALLATFFSFSLPGTIHAQADGASGCDPVRIMPLGDSITQGKGEIEGDPSLMVGYRKRLYDSLVAGGYRVDFVGSQRAGEAISPAFDVDHEGHSGWTTADLSAEVYSLLQANPAEVVLLHIGTNDVGKGLGLEVSTANVERILDEVDRYDPAIEVVLARIINKRTPVQWVSDFNERIAALAQDRIADGDRIYVVDHESALTYPDDLKDSVHPMQSGYDKMADVWLNALEDILPTTCAALAIVKDSDQVVRSGGVASFTITVTNTGDAPVSGVKVTDAATPDCNRTIGDLEARASWSYTCEASDVTASFTNSATVEGMLPTGLAVHATDTAVVTVINPSIAIVKEGDHMVLSGGVATFTITVTNTGDVALADVEVVDAATPGCNQVIGDLSVGRSETYTCAATDLTATFTNSATAIGFPPAGPPVSASDDALVTAIHPSISLQVSGDQTVARGATASFEIVVTNTGDTELTDVYLTASETPDCERAVETLVPGEGVSYTCQATTVTAPFTNSVTATGISPLGTPVVAIDSAHVDVLGERIFFPLVRK